MPALPMSTFGCFRRPEMMYATSGGAFTHVDWNAYKHAPSISNLATIPNMETVCWVMIMPIHTGSMNFWSSVVTKHYAHTFSASPLIWSNHIEFKAIGTAIYGSISATYFEWLRLIFSVSTFPRKELRHPAAEVIFLLRQKSAPSGGKIGK